MQRIPAHPQASENVDPRLSAPEVPPLHTRPSLAWVTVDIVDASVVDVWTAILAIGAFLVLNRWHGKLTVLYVVLGCGLIGAALKLTVL